MMDLADFRESFLKTAEVRAAADSTFRHSAFVEYAGEQLSDAGEVTDLTVAFYRGPGSKNRQSGVDAYCLDEADSSLRLLIAEPTFTDEATSFTLAEARPLLSRASTFVEDAISGRSLAQIEPSLPAWDLANTIHRRKDELARVRVYLVTDGVLRINKPDWAEGAIGSLPVEAHVWDIARFHRMAESAAGRDDLEIDFGVRIPGGLPCLPATDGNGEYQAYLMAVPGPVLADIYDQYGSRLLEGNVRSFLTTRPAVNKAIRNTALNQPWMFFAYNNGIAATASEIEIEDSPHGPRVTRVRDLQIVNGGQTTASLANARRTDKAPLGGVFVPMKLSVVTAERSGEMVPNIARYANSQNKVSEADFFSNHEFHRRIEGFSRRIWAPAKTGSQHETHWFYERARGQYLNEQAPLSPAKKRQFLEANPRDQLVTKTDLAKSEMAWREQPHVVSLGAQKNFLKFAEAISAAWATDDLQFNEGYFRDAMSRVLLFRRTERLVSAEPWYQGGYRANVVAYTMAKLARVVNEQPGRRTIDFDSLWRMQSVPNLLERQLRLIAAAMHEVITDPPSHVQNVTEWAKRTQCWEKASERQVEVVLSFQETLISKAVVHQAAQEDKRQQHQDSGIDAQVKVMTLGNDYWRRLREWATQKSLLLPHEDGMLRAAAGLSPSLPTEWQAPKLLALKARMELEGFPAPES